MENGKWKMPGTILSIFHLPFSICHASPYRSPMQIRPATMDDLNALPDIDGTVESTAYLHIDHFTEGLTASWKIEDRPARQKLIEPNRLADEASFVYKQIVSGADEGVVLVIETPDGLGAAIAAQERAERKTLY